MAVVTPRFRVLERRIKEGEEWSYKALHAQMAATEPWHLALKQVVAGKKAMTCMGKGLWRDYRYELHAFPGGGRLHRVSAPSSPNTTTTAYIFARCMDIDDRELGVESVRGYIDNHFRSHSSSPKDCPKVAECCFSPSTVFEMFGWQKSMHPLHSEASCARVYFP